jgi:hypothetical protein
MAERKLPDWAKDDQGDVVWLDDNHAVTWSQFKGETEPSGGVLWHRKTDNEWCCGAWFIREPTWNGKPFRENISIWQLVSKEPLTLSPSFLCHCGHHGFIRDGKWISA